MGTTTTTTIESTSVTNDYIYDYSEDATPKKEENIDENTEESETKTEEDKPTADAQDQDDPTKVKDSSPIIPVVIAVCLVILIGGLSIMFGLHYKRKLPACFYSMFSQRWKPVMNNDDFPQQDDEESKHPTIIKNGGLDDSVLS